MLTENDIRSAINAAGLTVDATTIPFDAPIREHMDSLDFFNLLVELEGVTGIKVPDERVESIGTLRELLDHFNGAQRATGGE